MIVIKSGLGAVPPFTIIVIIIMKRFNKQFWCIIRTYFTLSFSWHERVR